VAADGTVGQALLAADIAHDPAFVPYAETAAHTVSLAAQGLVMNPLLPAPSQNLGYSDFLSHACLLSEGGSFISRAAALNCLGILRDLDGIVGVEAATAQSDKFSKDWAQASAAQQPRDRVSLSKGGTALSRLPSLGKHPGGLNRTEGSQNNGAKGYGYTGSASTALDELGSSMLDVRAVLGGLFSEMKLLGELVKIQRWATIKVLMLPSTQAFTQKPTHIYTNTSTNIHTPGCNAHASTPALLSVNNFSVSHMHF
jgi:hypothetical protein